MQNIKEWEKWYAWRPVITINGEIVWLKTIQRRWSETAGSWIDPGSAYGFDEAGWEYKL